MTSVSVGELLRGGVPQIDAVDREYLLAHVLGCSRGWLYAHPEAPVSTEAAARYHALLMRRAAGEPVAYLTGRQGFWSLDLEVSPAVLIPRADTEVLVEQALLRLPVTATATVADLGTGSGAVALAIAKERPHTQVVATDLSAAALRIAQSNARRLGLGNVRFCQGDWLAPLAGERFDLIVSNPPYIAGDDPHLAQGDLRFEPMLALASGPDGLAALRAIVTHAPAHLRPGGWLLLEHGWQQGEAVRALLHAAGFRDVASVCDLEQRERVTFGRR